MSSDDALLHRYAHERAEDSFAELVRRHLDLVHSAALRQVGGDAHAAQDVAQRVFCELAQHAARLAGHPALVGWLYTTTRRMALEVVRARVRRERRESEAHAMQQLYHDSGPPPDWSAVSPVLDEAMHELSEADRVAVLLRCFERRPFAEVGARLGLGENAARMRVDRALDKLRARLAKRGVTSTAAALAVALGGPAVAAAPASLAATITTVALTAAPPAVAGIGTLAFMASMKIKTGIGLALAAAVATPLLLQHRALERLREENRRLNAEVATFQAREIPTPAPTPASNPNLEELVRLRSQVAQLTREKAELAGQLKRTNLTGAIPPAPPAPALVEHRFQDRGAASPDAAAESFLWSILSAETARFNELIDADLKSSEGMPLIPPEARERIARELRLRLETKGARMGRMKSLRELTPHSVEVRFEMEDADGPAEYLLFLRRVGDQWKAAPTGRVPLRQNP